MAEHEENLLAISISDINKLKSKYKIKDTDFKADRELLLDKYIALCLNDKRLEDSEKAQLSYLCKLLEVDESYLSNRITHEGVLIYKDMIKTAISDNQISETELQELKKLRDEFDISEHSGNDIYIIECNNKITDYINKITIKRRMSPEEEQALYDIVNGLNLKLNFAETDLSYFKQLWEIENGAITPIASAISLQKNENAYYTAQVNWYEERTRTSRVSYAGVATSVRIAKGVYLRSGKFTPAVYSEAYLKLIDTGSIFITNKRIIFVGEHANKSIPFSKIFGITTYANGIEIEKETGRKPFLECENAELSGLFMSRLLSDFTKQ